jgi:hypothetical protein
MSGATVTRSNIYQTITFTKGSNMNRTSAALFSLLALLVLLPLLVACGGAQSTLPTAIPEEATSGQSQQIPTGTAASSDATVPTTVAVEAESDLFEVISPTTYLAANGELQVAGIIKYKGSTQRVLPEVTVSLSGDSGASIASAPASSVPTLINPNSIIPYSVRFVTPPSKWAKLDVKVSAREAAEPDLIFQYAEFETAQTGIVNPPASESTRPVKVTGTIKNIGSKKSRTIKVSVALYYADGRVADVIATGPMMSTLAPGESSEFEAESIFATFEKQPVTRIEAVAFAMVDE